MNRKFYRVVKDGKYLGVGTRSGIAQWVEYGDAECFEKKDAVEVAAVFLAEVEQLMIRSK